MPHILQNMKACLRCACLEAAAPFSPLQHAQVEAVSAWILQMQSLLGDPEDADVVKMVVQEPR